MRQGLFDLDCGMFVEGRSRIVDVRDNRRVRHRVIAVDEHSHEAVTRMSQLVDHDFRWREEGEPTHSVSRGDVRVSVKRDDRRGTASIARGRRVQGA